MAAPIDTTSVQVPTSSNSTIFFTSADNGQHTLTSDSALFLPSNLQVARPIRAWERKPTTAFASGRSSTRKIWRRAPTAPVRTQQDTGVSRIRSKHDSPKNAKRVKRRCVSAEEAISTQWETLSSPAKRITTRSSLAKELVALSEDQEQELVADEGQSEVEGTIIEIVNDDGTLSQIDDLQDNEGGEWADEEDYNDTLMHLGEAVNHEANDLINTGAVYTSEEPLGIGESVEHDADVPPQQALTPEPVHVEPAAVILPTFAIPAGFVSPVKRHRSVSKRLNEAGRRRTLPHAFAPIFHTPQTSAQAATIEVVEEANASVEDGTQADTDTALTSCSGNEQADASEETHEEEWEDVETEAAVIKHNTTSHIINTSASGQSPTPPDAAPDVDICGTPEAQRLPTLQAPVAAALRRSPRRKSSSPVKARNSQPTKESSHIIAFTPIKTMRQAATLMQGLENVSPLQSSTPEAVPQTPPSMLKPSNNQQQESKRLDRSRLSDDTALLQAFLDRAAQNKHNGLQTTHEEKSQSSISPSNVREVLASPATVGVLLELDPNTTSPRKTAASPTPRVDQELDSPVEDVDSDSIEDVTHRTAKNSRDIRRSERIMTTAPAKITLRGIKENLATKRTPAQELFLLTGKNTRANKADAVPPAQRVPALMAELLELGPTTQQPPTKSTKKKTVTWTKALVFFEQSGSESADSEDVVPQESITESEDPKPAPIEPLKRRATPGKPRIRQLRAPSASVDLTAAATGTSQSVRKPVRSSIATPIKRVSLAGFEKSKSGIPSITGQLGSRRRLQTRLPAPVSVLEPPASVSAPVQNDTTASIMSPPKKRASLFIPNFEADSARVETVAKTTQAPGLASPAKKPRRAMVFGTVDQNSKAEDVSAKLKDIPSLSSPAKKRARKLC